MQALIAGQWQEMNCGLLCESAPFGKEQAQPPHDQISLCYIQGAELGAVALNVDYEMQHCPVNKSITIEKSII